MFRCALVIALLVVAVTARNRQRFEGLLRDKPLTSHVVNPIDYSKVAVPDTFSWANVNGTNWLTPSRNQHIPQYCGSCWAMSATSVLADRMKIMRNAQWPEYMVAVQTVVYCASSGCMGGSLTSAFEFVKDNGVGTDPCQNYVALGNGQNCTAINKCQNCMPGKGCWAVADYPTVGVSEYGTILGEQQMMAEIVARGPIVCGIDAGPIVDWYMPQAAGVFTGGVNDNDIDHAISVVGFGTENGTPYWLIRNSWGEYWGDSGFFKLQRGQNNLGIEKESCSWAVPIAPKAL